MLSTRKLSLCLRPSAVALAGVLLIVGFARASTPLNLDSYRGQVVYIDFWASWCTPCRQSFPWMQSMLSQHGKDGLVVIAINLDRKQQDADRFLAQFSPSFNVLFDPSGAEALRWQVHGMPTSVLIDKSGAVRFTHTGFSLNERSQYEHQINTLLTEKRGRQ